ncbi:MAG TPA: hypothetical protein VK557_06065 [Pyrinomonadaceae bacterium]|nr:hypothetical protein [Pyrinomonadaceae bacterium]
MAPKEDGKIRRAARRLFTLKSLPAWLLSLIPLWKPFYNLLEAVHNLDFVLAARENPRMKWVWHFLTSQTGTFLVMLIGLSWLIYRVSKTPNQSGGAKAISAPTDTDETAQEIDFSPSPNEKLLSEKQSLEEALIRRRSEITNLEGQLKTSQDQLQAHGRLIETAIDDKAAIKDLVMVCIVRCSTEIDEGDSHVAFTFHVLNMSLYPVSVESVQGLIKFSRTLNPARKRIPLRMPRSDGITNNLAQHIPFRQTGSFTICQPLTPENALFVGALEGLFWLSDLTITITGDEFETFVIPSGTVYVEKDRDWYANNPESYFIYRDTVRAEAKLRRVEAERDGLRDLSNQRVGIAETLSNYVTVMRERFNRDPQSRQPLKKEDLEYLKSCLAGAAESIEQWLGLDAVREFFDGSKIEEPPPDTLGGQLKWMEKYEGKLRRLIAKQYAQPPAPDPPTLEEEEARKKLKDSVRAWVAK